LGNSELNKDTSPVDVLPNINLRNKLHIKRAVRAEEMYKTKTFLKT